MSALILEGRRILVVEDEMLIQMVLEDMLGDLGCRSISSVATVGAALALARVEAFDAALLDVNLCGEKSYPVARLLTTRSIPFLFSTGYSDHGTNSEFKGCPILHKPFRIDDLSDLCRKWFLNSETSAGKRNQDANPD